MHAHYEDITSRIAQEPLWYDQHGVPRYAPFAPLFCPNIYARHVVLLRIACQACQRQFDVEMHSDIFRDFPHPKKLHYGDSPNHGCIGDTMNCNDLAVLEVWTKLETLGEWKRHPELEGAMDEPTF